MMNLNELLLVLRSSGAVLSNSSRLLALRVDSIRFIHRNLKLSHQLRGEAEDSSMENDAPQITPELLAFASRIYDGARSGQRALFEQALPAGLPANMTNEKGDSLVRLHFILLVHICECDCLPRSRLAWEWSASASEGAVGSVHSAKYGSFRCL